MSPAEIQLLWSLSLLIRAPERNKQILPVTTAPSLLRLPPPPASRRHRLAAVYTKKLFPPDKNEPRGIGRAHLAVSTGTARDHSLIKEPLNSFRQRYDKVLTLGRRKAGERWWGASPPSHFLPGKSPRSKAMLEDVLPYQQP